MGNSSNKPLWPPSKLFRRESKTKGSKKKKSKAKRTNSAPPVAPMYDTVAEVPLYSVVNKSQKRNIKAEENVQYAEIEVVRRPPPPQPKLQKKPTVWPKPETTEYATINFNPQEHYPSKNSPVNQYSSVHHSGFTVPNKPTRKYNSVNGTLV